MNRKPTHPGKIIKEDYLLPLAISITEMAAILGVSRKTVSKKTNERGVITPLQCIGYLTGAMAEFAKVI